jgi:excisionase family DNA binding protein
MPKEILGVKLYSIDEVSELLGVNHQTVTRYVKNGRMDTTMLAGKRLISEEQLKNYLLNGAASKQKK